jgi:hypothetical protein
LRAKGAVSRNGDQFTLNRPADKEEGSLLKFLAQSPAMKGAAATPTALLARMKWGNLTLFNVEFRGKQGSDTLIIPVQCAKECVASLPQAEVPGVADPQFPLTTFAYLEEERARAQAGEPARTRAFPVTLKVFPDKVPPTNPFPITFRVDVRLAFAEKSRPSAYDFASQTWRGKLASNETEWRALVKFLTGLRKAGPAGAPAFLDKAFGSDQARYFLYTANEFETKNGAVTVTSPLLEPAAFAAKVATWKLIVPLGTVQDGAAVRLLFSTSAQLEDVQQMPINCGGGDCRVVVDEWVSYVHGVIQQPALLKLYRSMFQKAAAGSAGK